MLAANRSARTTPVLEFVSKRSTLRSGSAPERSPCYNLGGPTSCATACSCLLHDRRGDWHFLLVSAGAFSPGSGRFQLGHRGRAGPTRTPQPLRPSDAAVPPDLRAV